MQKSAMPAKRAESYSVCAQLLQVERAVDDHAQQHRVEDRDHRRLGRREEPADDAADDDAPA